ncbi:MAG: hypothetical protein V4664_02005 [Patescibacteria group bacterium]
MKQQFLKKRGFSLIELVIIIGMTAIIGTMTLFAFRGFSDYQILDKQTDTIQSYIDKARVEAMNSKSFSNFGIRFATSTITLFQGSTYAASTSNFSYNFPSSVQISSILLTGGVTDIYFKNVTGEPNATGTITLRLASTPSSTKSIIIYGTGLSEVR